MSQPNNVKDGVLLAQRDAIRYESTGKSNLTKDVTLYFQKLISVELEMQPHVRLSPYLKIKHCAKVLTKEILALSASTSSLPLATANYPFNTFKNDVLELCNNLHVSEAHHHDHDRLSNISVMPQDIAEEFVESLHWTTRKLKRPVRMGAVSHAGTVVLDSIVINPHNKFQQPLLYSS